MNEAGADDSNNLYGCIRRTSPPSQQEINEHSPLMSTGMRSLNPSAVRPYSLRGPAHELDTHTTAI